MSDNCEEQFEDNMDTIEDFIIEESQDHYAIDIKQEEDYQSEEILIFENCDQYINIPLKNESNNSKDYLNNADINQDCPFNDHDAEGNNLEISEQPNEIISENTDLGMMELNSTKFEVTNTVQYSGEEDFVSKSKSIIVCENCQAILEEEKDISEHQCNVNEENIKSLFSCPDCLKTFPLITMLQKHQNTHKKSKTQNQKGAKKNSVNKNSDQCHCFICNTTFSSQKNLKLHSKMHKNSHIKTIEEAMPVGSESREEDKFFCEICNKSFNHSLLFVHQNMHKNVEEHNCSLCNRQFENQVSYDMHMQLHADQPIKVRSQQYSKPGANFACNYCGKEFLRPHEKVKHERIHTGEKPYECEVCGKSFRVSYSLTLHLRTHTDIRPFVCAHCNKRFKSYAVYSHHLNTHSEDRPYKCPMCPKSFRTSVQLCGHKNSHTKPYNCPECNRPFSSLYAVKMHMKTHNKANKSSENLKYRCETCGAVYARMFALRFHMKDQHAKDLNVEQDSINCEISTENDDESKIEDEISTQAILSGEEIIIDNFQPEEIVTDWLIKK